MSSPTLGVHVAALAKHVAGTESNTGNSILILLRQFDFTKFTKMKIIVFSFIVMFTTMHRSKLPSVLYFLYVFVKAYNKK